MNKKVKIVYTVVKVLFSLLVVMGASQYFFNHNMVKDMFEQINFPTYLIYPMGVVKFLGLIAIWTKVPKTIKEWAYAGYLYNFLLAISAHLAVNDGEHFGAVIALTLLVATYVLDRKANPREF